MDGLAADELRARVVAVLGVGAMPETELRAALGQEWAPSEHRDGLDRVLAMDTEFGEVSAGFVHVPTVCEGTTWTVWVDADDAAAGFVRVHPSLSPLAWWLVGDGVELVDVALTRVGGLRVENRVFDDADVDVLCGPAGWLDEVAGGWASVEVVDGALRWSRIATPPAPTARQIAAVRAGFEHAIHHDAVEHGDHRAPPDQRFAIDPAPVHEALQVDRSAFVDAPIPPLTDLYVAAALEQRGSIVAVDGFDWPGLRAWQEGSRIRLSYRLDDEQADAAMALLRAYDDGAVGPDAVAALDDGHVAEVCWDLLHGWRAVEPEDLVAFADALGAATGTSVGPAWLRARAVDRAGDTAAAIATLTAAVGPRCVHGPALVDLAGFCADRGDAPGAGRLLQRAGVDERVIDDVDDHDISDGEVLWREIEEFARHRPRPVARRNDPCPCGSGRKYKACHLGRETHSLDDRAGWLYQKAQRFLRHRQPDLVHELAERVVDPDDDDRFEELAHGVFLADVALHEAGVFASFLAARHDLLPDDEALLATQWSLVDRSIFEILEVHGGRLRLRNTANSELITVVNTWPDERTRRGVLLVGRPLPVGATYRAFGGFLPLAPVHLDQMQAALDAGDLEDVTAAVAAVVRPPRMTNTDGHDIVLQTITWRVPDSADIAAALATTGLRADDEDTWTLVRDTQHQPETLIARFELDGDELIADVNSLERAMEIVNLVTAALPAATLVDVETHPLQVPDAMSMSGASQLDVDDVSVDFDADDSALRAAMAEITAEFERRWLDESIPALGGMTPRQAAADPIGREQLHRLLASFPVPADGDVGSMNPDRLRAALDL